MDEPELRPIYAHSLIHVSQPGDGSIVFSQVLMYEYEDLSKDHKYYHKIMRDHDFLKRELDEIEKNMQKFFDEEENVVNGKRVYPKIISTSIDFKTDRRLPFYTWIIAFTGPESDIGTQVYEARIEGEKLEYDAKSIYIFPARARIVEIESSLDYQNDIKNIVIYNGRKGTKVKQLERIAWILERSI